MTLVSARDVDAWLAELALEPVERDERDGIASWDLVLDGRRRTGVRLTLILDPALALVLWVHYSPPLNDSFRVSYRRFLRWNDELPFVKFGLSDDERPVLSSEIPVDALGRERLGLAVARLLAVCDLLLTDSARWLWPGGRAPADAPRPSPSPLLERYASELAPLAAAAPESKAAGDGEGSSA